MSTSLFLTVRTAVMHPGDRQWSQLVKCNAQEDQYQRQQHDTRQRTGDAQVRAEHVDAAAEDHVVEVEPGRNRSRVGGVRLAESVEDQITEGLARKSSCIL